MTLVEVMVVLAIIVALVGLGYVGYAQITALEQRQVAKKLALSYGMLHDEAVLRNATFRIAYHLDGAYYVVEVGEPDTLIYATPDERIEAEEKRQSALRRYTEREIAEGEAKHLEDNKFAELQARFGTKVQLPRGSRFGGVYTPQYGEFVEPSGAEEEDPEQPLIVYSYIFANGFSEHALVQIVDRKDPTEGYTVEVEPLSGKVTLHGELVGYQDAWDWIPEKGPELPG
ncbi:MAG: type II secretion system protein [Deltaproteobacteria bacterium]|nr:type II secretion system protein [Deltaproteobacteria bacterium]